MLRTLSIDSLNGAFFFFSYNRTSFEVIFAVFSYFIFFLRILSINVKNEIASIRDFYTRR